jgi:hypothetical protein
MAAGAIVVARPWFHLGGMIATLIRKTKRNFLMAIQAAELCRSGAEHMTFGALQRTVEIVVRPTEWTRRHLRDQFRSERQRASQQQRNSVQDHSQRQVVFWQSRSQKSRLITKGITPAWAAFCRTRGWRTDRKRMFDGLRLKESRASYNS